MCAVAVAWVWAALPALLAPAQAGCPSLSATSGSGGSRGAMPADKSTTTTTEAGSTTVVMEAGSALEPSEAPGLGEPWAFDPELADDMDACFTAFDKDGDGYLDLKEFGSVCRALFRNDKGKIYSLEPKQLYEIFNIFDRNKDGYIDREEFTRCWNQWIKTIVRPVSVFLVVDVQNDFISGTLNISQCAAQQNGLDVIEPINRLLDTVEFDAVFYSLDWHPSDHVSFIDNLPYRKLDDSSPIKAEDAKTYDTVVFAGPPLMKQRLWPRHCVQDSWGAELHKDLKVVEGAIKICKGTNPEVDSYSVFWDNKKLTRTTLGDELRARNATDIYVCGLAYDVCVGASALDALSIGYRTILIDDCSRGVDLNDIEKTKQTVASSSGVIVNSNQIKAMVEGRDRRAELGYKLAIELRKREEDPEAASKLPMLAADQQVEVESCNA